MEGGPDPAVLGPTLSCRVPLCDQNIKLKIALLHVQDLIYCGGYEKCFCIHISKSKYSQKKTMSVEPLEKLFNRGEHYFSQFHILVSMYDSGTILQYILFISAILIAVNSFFILDMTV